MTRILPAGTAGVVQSAFRIVVGFLFACHGASSLFGILQSATGPHWVARFAEWPGWWAAVIQLVGGTLVAVGLGTRIAAIVNSGAMAYAYFVVHQRHGALPIQNGGELAAIYSWLFLLIAVIGPGPIALDRLLRSRRTRPATATPAEPTGAGTPATARRSASTVPEMRRES